MPNVTSLSFNEDDSVLAATTLDGTVQRYNMFTFKRWPESIIDRDVQFTASLFLDNARDADKSRLIYVGGAKNTDPKKEGGVLRINDEHDVNNLTQLLQDGTP